MNKFLFIPKPLPDESPSSILRRMAKRHGLVKKSDLSLMSIPSTYIGPLLYRNHPIPQEIAKSISTPEDRESFLSGFYHPISALLKKPKVILSGMEVPAEFIRTSETAYCSECRASDHEYFIKDLTLTLYCPYHSRKYLRKCPQCGYNLAWHWILDDHCRCPELPESDLCSVEDFTFEQRLLSIFKNRETESLKELFKYLNLLGYRRTDESQCSATRAITLLALAIMDRDEYNILKQLNHLNYLYPEIPRRIICAKLARIRTKETEHCTKVFLTQQHNFCPESDHGSLPLKSSFHLNRSQIYAWLSVNHKERRLLSNEKHFSALNAKYPVSKIEIMEQRVLEFRTADERNIKQPVNRHTVKTLQEKFAVSAICIQEAVSEKLLSPYLGPRHQWFFSTEDVEQFSNKFISIQLLSIQLALPPKTIRKALKRFRNLDVGVRKPAFRRYVISKQQKDAVMEWLSRTEIRVLHSKQPHHVLPHLTGKEKGTWLSAREASVEIGVAPITLKDLIRKGLLPCDYRELRGNGYALNKAQLLQFKKTYIGTTESCGLLKCNLHATSRILKASGILPITGPDIDGGERNFFLRKFVTAHAKKLNTLNNKKTQYYNIEDACKKLRLSKKTLATLIEAGALPSCNFTGGQDIALDKTSIDNFFATYSTANTIAKALNISTPCLRQELNKKGISPIAGTQQKGLGQHIYEINAIREVYPLIETLIRTNKKNLAAIWSVHLHSWKNTTYLHHSFLNSSPIRDSPHTWNYLDRAPRVITSQKAMLGKSLEF
ncbi:helix-turn-helix domain-containing protein [Pseudomonas putida]|uniref:Helix-turn-helix domain-containing protein n=1 Tax=Pseudomonas putida TaxID=303 RepID=A0A7W2QLC6_PSEPU|nr:helix-turn-helix domain-containing protein [Pseudomonas putida]MBA6118900.1 helix-turn-helix domain-containing protein [Pseudomonas putida]